MNKISVKELVPICFSLIITAFPCFGTTMILNYGKNTSLFAIILGSLIGLIPLSMIIYLSKFTKNKTIFKINHDNFKIIGSFINILYIIGIIFIGLCTSWSIVNFTVTQLLTRTSYFIISLIFFTIIAFAVTKGIEVIGRSSIILTFLGVFMVIIILCFLIPEIEIENIYPLFNVSFKNFLETMFFVPTFSVYPLITLLIIKKNDLVNQNKFNKYIYITYFLASFIIFVFIFLIISIYGIPFAKLFSYPEYYLFKTVDAFEFITRVENIAAIIIYVSFFGSMCLLISFVKTYLQETFKIKKEKSVNITVYILANIVPLIAIILFKKKHFFKVIKYYPLISSIILIALTLNFILFFFKKKELKNNS